MYQTKTNKPKIQKYNYKKKRKVLVKYNVEMKSKISTQEIILKQKEREGKKGRMSSMRFKKI